MYQVFLFMQPVHLPKYSLPVICRLMFNVSIGHPSPLQSTVSFVAGSLIGIVYTSSRTSLNQPLVTKQD